MELQNPRVWIRLFVTIRPDGDMAIGLTDDLGHRARPPRREWQENRWQDVRIIDWLIGQRLRVLLPTALPRILRDTVERLATGPAAPPLLATVPVFVTSPRELAFLPMDLLRDAVTSGTTPDVAGRLFFVQDRQSVAAVEPFELPLRITAVGERGSEAIDVLRQGSPWITGDPQLQEHLAEFEWVDDVTALEVKLAAEEIDILLLDAGDATDLGRLVGERRETSSSLHSVRLSIVLGAGDGGPLEGATVALPDSRSVLTVVGPQDAQQLEFVRKFLFNISHDAPLHDVLQVTSGGFLPLPRRTWLSASPDSLHDLRLTPAWEAIERSWTHLHGMIGRGDLRKLNLITPDHDVVENYLDGGQLPLVALVEKSQALQLDFARESGGLHPLARIRQNLALAEDVLHRVQSLQGITYDVRAANPRVVNLGLRRANAAVAIGAMSAYVETNRCLTTGAAYELDVQIGAAWPNNLVVGDQTPIDLLLPDSRHGHELQVVLFSESFVVSGPSIRFLHLPPAGASSVLTFPLTAPVVSGNAWLRLSIYHRDNLVQTFRLDARVERYERYHPIPVMQAVLQHSGTQRWENLDSFGDRALSVTLNTNPGGGHQIFIKQLDVAETVPIDTQAQKKLTDRVRKVLTAMVKKELSSTDAVWELAQLGRELFRSIFDRLSREHREALRGVSQSADMTLQIIRADPMQALPWALIYDRELPNMLFGDPAPKVCLGSTADNSPCHHDADDTSVCVRGFWGLRHNLEELLADPRRVDLPRQIAVASPAALLALGVKDDAKLLETLELVLGAGQVHSLTEDDYLLDGLFDSGRPAVVAVLGHHEQQNFLQEPVGSRIRVHSKDRWLLAAGVSDRGSREGGDWKPPHSLVLLLSCASAAVGPTEMTSFLTAFQGVGAGAIVGTECDIYPDMAVTFAQHLLVALNTPRSSSDFESDEPRDRTRNNFAEAIRLTRQRVIIEKGDVRALAFNAFGPAELCLVQQ